MNATFFRKSFIVGLVGGAVSGLYAFLRVGSDDGYVGIISGLAALTGFIVITILTLTILFFTSKKSNLSKPLFIAILLIAVVLLFGVAQIWL